MTRRGDAHAGSRPRQGERMGDMPFPGRLAGGIMTMALGASAGGSFSSDISKFFTASPTDKAI
jgi:hypothetical protein